MATLFLSIKFIHLFDIPTSGLQFPLPPLLVIASVNNWFAQFSVLLSGARMGQLLTMGVGYSRGRHKIKKKCPKTKNKRAEGT